MTKNRDFSPGILSMLPLFYVGWSDSVLSPSEVKIIHDKMDQFKFLTAEDKKYLTQYTNPANPPSREIFKSWVQTIKSGAENLEESQKTSLAEIGLQIAMSSTSYKSDSLFKAPETAAALRDIESALGVEGSTSRNLLLDKLDTDSEEEDSLSFDVSALQDVLDGDQKEVKDRIRKLIRDPFFKFRHIADKQEYRLTTLAQLKELANQGLGSYAFPSEYGGKDMVRESVSVFETLAYNDNSLTIKYGVQFGLFGGAVYGLGTERHHKKYVKDMTEAKLLGCFAMTETNHGSNVKGLKTTATYNREDNTITINTPTRQDGKEYIGNALHSSMAAVFAQLMVNGDSQGVHCILVPVRDESNNLMPGVEIEDNGYKLGLNGVDNGRLWFNNVKVPAANLLNKYGDIDGDGNYTSSIPNPNKRFFTMLGALVAGRVSVGMAGISCSKTALAIAVKYALKRKQFNGNDPDSEVTIMDYPTHQKRLIPLIAKAYGYHFAISKLADRYATADESEVRKIETDAAGLKAMATWFNTSTIQECREACGGKGYLAENRFANLKADSDIFTTFEGDNTVLMQLVAKGALTEFKQSFHNDGAKAIFKYIGDRVSNTIAEFNPVSTRYTSYEHLTDRDFHREAFRYRYRKLLLTLSGRMSDYLKKRIKPFDAFLKCQVHMMELAKAYTDRYVLYEFRKAIEATEDKKSKRILNKLCDLYALTILEENKGWFLENDYMEGSKTKAIRRVHNKICQQLRPEIEGLVDAWGIPDEVIAAPIALE
jgi:acyl-CoA oxidase